MSHMIEVKDLRKSYGDVQAVKGIGFYVERGKLFAFLGPNGAGKSTTIDMICTFLRPDAGTVIVDGKILGQEDDAIRSIIGAVFQDGVLDPLLTVGENLRIRGSFYGIRGRELETAVRRAAEVTGITDLMKRPYGKLSGGQRRRCDIARALINTPRVLFLDEPTTGLDPQTRKNVWETIQTLQRETDMTIFLTTHYMEEAAEADYVVVIDHGEIAARGTPAELKAQYARDTLRLVCGEMDGAKGVLDGLGRAYTQTADQLIVPVESTFDALPIVAAAQPYLTGFEVLMGTMDDAFIGITGKGIRE
jgi:multidrug/hemolysin transport system ATP-binding protein